MTAVRQALEQAGVHPAGYSGHSFRIGAATTAAQAGLDDSTIKMLGRWESAAYQRYIRTPRTTLAAITARLAALNTYRASGLLTGHQAWCVTKYDCGCLGGTDIMWAGWGNLCTQPNNKPIGMQMTCSLPTKQSLISQG